MRGGAGRGGAAGCGYDVLGIDAAGAAIAAARAHAEAGGLALEYREAAAEELLGGERFGAISALEVIEHVADPVAFVATLSALLEPGGMLFVSTLNRTARSMIVAKLGGGVSAAAAAGGDA